MLVSILNKRRRRSGERKQTPHQGVFVTLHLDAKRLTPAPNGYWIDRCTLGNRNKQTNSPYRGRLFIWKATWEAWGDPWRENKRGTERERVRERDTSLFDSSREYSPPLRFSRYDHSKLIGWQEFWVGNIACLLWHKGETQQGKMARKQAWQSLLTLYHSFVN